ncbi:MAG TPA: carbonic anhydrase [Sphingomonas sp.]|jgi:carbonic anhydrase|uniref:carbonic anhydrase n=1 Tax=Sphingomonas sp. TaxID=28214 RepID=UPI002EDA908E
MASFANMIEGYHRFHEQSWKVQHERWAELAEGQSPKVMVIACADSRVSPAQIFDVAPGEIFSVRNVANLVPPYETGGGLHGVSAALEFAVTQLEVPEIVVMGHASCGGVKATLTRAFDDAELGQGGFVSSWVGILSSARDRVTARLGAGHEHAQRELEWEGVRQSLGNLMTFPFVRERVEAGSLALRGAWFEISSGELRVMDQNGDFLPA